MAGVVVQQQERFAWPRSGKACVGELRSTFEAVCESLLRALGDGAAVPPSTTQRAELEKQCTEFNNRCDELYKLLTTYQEQLLHGDESVEVHPDMTDAQVQQHVDTTAALQKQVRELSERLLTVNK